MVEAHDVMQHGDALLIIDVQNDFCPGGALPVEDGNKVIPVLNNWISIAKSGDIPVYASRDWHPRDHVSFEPQGGPWPVHCVQDTKGAAFHSDLDLPDNVTKVTKGTRFDKDQYSAFDETGLAEGLRRKGIKRLWIGGLAQDVCVRATALDAANEGFETHLIADATRPVSEDDGRTAIEEMRKAGVTIEN